MAQGTRTDKRSLNSVRIRTKIMVGISLMLIALMIATTVVIAYFIFQQNRETSFAMLRHGIEIIQEDLELKARQLDAETRKITGIEAIVQNIDSLMIMKQSNVGDSGMEYMQQEIVQQLQDMTQKSLVWKALIHTMNGELIGFILTQEGGIVMGFPDKGQYQVIFLKPDQMLEFNSWKTVASFNGIEEVSGPIEAQQPEGVQFYPSGNAMTIFSKSLINIKRFNHDTNVNESVPMAVLSLYHRIDINGIQHLSKLTGSKINVFAGDRYSAGNLPSYMVIQTESFTDTAANWKLMGQKAVYGVVDVQGDSFFQAAFPVYGSSKKIGYIASLIQADIAMQNTWQIISLLSLISFIGIVCILPLIYFLTTKISRPLENMAIVIEEIKESGDFSSRVEVYNRDEIGITGLAYNALMETLQTAINGINTVMEAAAAGDLSKKVEGEFKGDVQRMQASINQALVMLGNTVIQVAGVSDHVHSSSVELKNAAQNLADGSSQQAASLQQISSSMAEVRQNANHNSQYAASALNLTGKTIETVRVGNQKMDGMLQSMSRIHSTSLQVGKVIKVIDEIAFQTNLLALNAAVEAARAGKYGKGFAVVAQEVRSLASRSAAAAKSTGELIESAAKQVETGVKEANETADALDKITESVNEVNSLVDKISAASKEQQTGTEEINKGLELINTVVQQNSAISEETSSSAAVLSSHSENLHMLMQQFKVQDQDSEPVEPPVVEQLPSNTYAQLEYDDDGSDR